MNRTSMIQTVRGSGVETNISALSGQFENHQGFNESLRLASAFICVHLRLDWMVSAFAGQSAKFRIARLWKLCNIPLSMKRLGHIIMADDNQNDVSLVSYAFKEAGLDNRIQWLHSGEMLIRQLTEDRAQQQMPLLVVMDWKMPGTNPLNILRWIRKQPEYLSLLVVVLTGSESPIEKQLAYEAGANWHIVKSSDFADLAQLVHRIQQFWSRATDSEPSGRFHCS